MYENFESLLEGVGYWLNSRGSHLVSQSDTSGLAHASYFDPESWPDFTYNKAIGMGWIAIRDWGPSAGWGIVVKGLDQRTKDRIWDWAKEQKKDGQEVGIYRNIDGHKLGSTTIARIQNFDFGNGTNESFCARVNHHLYR